MRARVLALVSLLLVTGCGTLPRGPGPQDLALTREEKEFAEALAHFAQGLIDEREIGPHSPETVREFARAAELDPGRHRLHAKVALAALRDNDADKAIRVLEESCRHNPGRLQPRIDLAVACQISGRFDLAAEHYRTAIDIAPQQASLYLTLAGLLFHLQNDDEALAVLGQALDRADNPPQVIAYCYTRGKQFVDLKQADRAVKCFTLVAERHAEHTHRLLRLIGELYITLGNEKLAIDYLERATRREPVELPSFVRLALLYVRSDPAKAMQTLVRGDEALPDNPEILLVLAHMYSSQKRFNEAAVIYARLRTLALENEAMEMKADFYLQYGSALERAGRIEEAEAVFEECIEHFPDTHQVLNYLAYMWAERGENLSRADAYVHRALKQEPDNGAYVDTLGWILYQEGKYDEALRALRRAHTLYDSDPTIIHHIGDTHQALGNLPQAIEFWERCFLIDPQNTSVAAKLKANGIDVNKLRKKAVQPPPETP